MIRFIFSPHAWRIHWALIRYRVVSRLFGPHYRFAKWLGRINPFVSHRKLSRGEALCACLEDLGPIFVKFGQSLSTRPDVFPTDIVQALSRLRDQVKPFETDQAIAVVEKSMGQSIAQCFASFDAKPIASASVAQVHGAILDNGDEVVVKIIRPGIETIIKKDLKLMHQFATYCDKHFKKAKRLRLPELVSEFEHTILQELDLRYEASNASLLKRNFKDSSMMHVPTMYWDYCHKAMLVSERIKGIPIDNLEQLKAHGVDRAQLARHGVEIFFTQVFRDRFFHADMHAGNIFVDIKDPKNPIYCAVDFGIMGTLDEDDQYYLAKNLLAFFKGDYETMARLHIQSGWVPADTRVTHLEAALRTVCEPIYQKPLEEISFAKLLLQLFDVAGKFEMRVQPQLMLLQKTLFHVEGLGRQLDAPIDLWKTALPVLETWAKERYSLLRLAKKAIKQFPEKAQMLLENPELLIESLAYLKDALHKNKS